MQAQAARASWAGRWRRKELRSYVRFDFELTTWGLDNPECRRLLTRYESLVVPVEHIDTVTQLERGVGLVGEMGEVHRRTGMPQAVVLPLDYSSFLGPAPVDPASLLIAQLRYHY